MFGSDVLFFQLLFCVLCFIVMLVFCFILFRSAYIVVLCLSKHIRLTCSCYALLFISSVYCISFYVILYRFIFARGDVHVSGPRAPPRPGPCPIIYVNIYIYIYIYMYYDFYVSLMIILSNNKYYSISL